MKKRETKKSEYEKNEKRGKEKTKTKTSKTEKIRNTKTKIKRIKEKWRNKGKHIWKKVKRQTGRGELEITIKYTCAREIYDRSQNYEADGRWLRGKEREWDVKQEWILLNGKGLYKGTQVRGTTQTWKVWNRYA